MGPLRSIFHEHGFDDRAASIFGSIERADIALEGALWALANLESLDVLPVIAETPRGMLRAIKTEQVPAIPAVIVYFTVGEGRVFLHDIMISSPSPEEL